MFIKKIQKAEKTYYIVVAIERKQDGTKVFANEFIPEKLALALAGAGVPMKEKK